MGELERPHERECTTLAVNMECSASREEKQQQPPRDGGRSWRRLEAARPGNSQSGLAEQEPVWKMRAVGNVAEGSGKREA